LHMRRECTFIRIWLVCNAAHWQIIYLCFLWNALVSIFITLFVSGHPSDKLLFTRDSVCAIQNTSDICTRLFMSQSWEEKEE
jgi:hypothetical protein